MLVGHNPGLEELLTELTGRYQRMPTCALARISLPINDWQELTPGTTGEIGGVWLPRELFDAD